jgi:hypothetical protein
MDFSLLLMLLTGVYFLRRHEQRGRIRLLGQHLGRYDIEKHMETLTLGYQRALGETDLARQAQIWQLMAPHERALAEQFNRLATDFSRVPEAQARVSRWPLPYASALFPQLGFDLRRLLMVHAQGIAQAVNTDGIAPRERAFTLLAELLLMQHSCHWFCRSRAVASARLLRRHQTRHAQALAAVSPLTRAAYLKLAQG